MGLVTGSVLVRPISAFLGSTTVTWDALNCPAGIYTITALARGTNNTRSYSVTTSNVSLPKGAVVQQFQDLPSGSYYVSATASTNDGRTFHSQLLTVTGNGDGGVILGRSRRADNPATGIARGRNQPVEDPPRPPTDRKVTPSTVSINAPATDASLPRTEIALEPDARRVLIQLVQESDGTDRLWRRVEVVDEDADGFVDYVTVESLSGEIWIYRFHGS